MRGFIVGALTLLLVICGGFAALVVLADAGAPQPSEVRIEVSDALRSDR